MTGQRLRRKRLPRTIDRERYTPAFLSLIANALSWGGSQIYLRHFGVGTNDWRVLSALGNSPGATAAELGRTLGLDKSVVSRTTGALMSSGLIAVEPHAGRRCLFLTAAGVRAHDAVLPVALRREDLLLTGFTPAEREQLRRFLRRMFDNLPLLDDHDPRRDETSYDVERRAGRAIGHGAM